MNHEELIKRLRSIYVWSAQGSTARKMLEELIVQLGGRV
jgi:hypothetical protein